MRLCAARKQALGVYFRYPEITEISGFSLTRVRSLTLVFWPHCSPERFDARHLRLILQIGSFVLKVNEFEIETIWRTYPVPALVFCGEAEFMVREVSDAWLSMTGKKREDIAGKSLRALFADGESAVTFTTIRSSLQHVLLQKKSHKVPLLQYDNLFGPHHNGKFFVSAEQIPLQDDRGNVRFILHVVKDLSEADQRFVRDTLADETEAALALRVKTIMNGTRDAILLADDEGKYVQANRASLEMLGYSEEALLELKVKDIVVTMRSEEGSDLWSRFQEDGRQSGIIDLKKKDGSVITCQYNAWSNIVPGKHLSILTDITEKQKLDERIREKEQHFKAEQERFSDMFREAPVTMCILKGGDHIFEKTNALFQKLIQGKNVIGKSVREAFPELEGQGWFELLDYVYRTGETVSQGEKLFRFESEGAFKEAYLNFMYQPYKNHHGDTEGIFYFGVDITEQVLARKKVEESERRYRQIVETAQEGIWLIDAGHRTVFVNQKMGEILEFSTHEMTGRSMLEFIDPAEKGSIEDLLHHGFGAVACSLQIRFISKSGRVVWAFLKTARIVEKNGAYKGMLAMVTDITERRMAEEELNRLSLIARSTTNAIIIRNPAGEIEWVNEAFTSITGFSFAEIAGRTSHFLHGMETDQATVRLIGESIRRMEPFECEILKYRKSGMPFWVQVQGRPVFHEDGTPNYYFQMETDITERKQAYQQLSNTENQVRTFARQLNHMLEDERSRIAREIHDEFGQHLMGFKMSLSSLDRLSGLPAEAASVIRTLLSGVESTFQSMRNFATELRPGILDTLGLVPSIEWLAQGFEKRSGIPCLVSIHVGEQMFEKDVSTNYFRICQEALTNIMKHAQATRVGIHMVQDGEALMMEISDNGKGILSENLDNPFSLGLLGMRERARLIGGHLKIDSDPEHGTRIQLTGKVNGS